MKIWLNDGKNEKNDWGWQWTLLGSFDNPLALGPGDRVRIADIDGDGVNASNDTSLD
jgi:hypothetical protein